MSVPKISLDPAKRNKGEESITVSKYFCVFLASLKNVKNLKCIKYSRIFSNKYRKILINFIKTYNFL